MNDELTWVNAQRLGNAAMSALTVREWLCGLAMGGLLNWRERQDTPEKIAALAWDHADKLLLEMARRGGTPAASADVSNEGECRADDDDELVDLHAPPPPDPWAHKGPV